MVQVHLRAPRLARSTVYRALDVLIESGAVRALQLGNGPTYYEQAVREHQHAVCQACGQISHLEDDLSAPIERHLEDFHGFKPLRIEVLVFGICDSCSRARRPRTTARRTLEHVHLNRLGLADPAPAGEE
jgi:Fur family ferric uptake transcriptional regulator